MPEHHVDRGFCRVDPLRDHRHDLASRSARPGRADQLVQAALRTLLLAPPSRLADDDARGSPRRAPPSGRGRPSSGIRTAVRSVHVGHRTQDAAHRVERVRDRTRRSPWLTGRSARSLAGRTQRPRETPDRSRPGRACLGSSHSPSEQPVLQASGPPGIALDVEPAELDARRRHRPTRPDRTLRAARGETFQPSAPSIFSMIGSALSVTNEYREGSSSHSSRVDLGVADLVVEDVARSKVAIMPPTRGPSTGS